MAKIYIRPAATITSIGLNTVQTTTSARAAIVRTGWLTWKDKSFAPIVMASVPDGCMLPVEIGDDEKYIPFGQRGLRILRLMYALQKEYEENFSDQPAVPLIMGLPQHDGLDAQSEEILLQHMAAFPGINRAPQYSKLICKGRASGLLAIIEGVKLLESKTVQSVLVGGCDSYKDLKVLGALNYKKRLKSEKNRDGFIPGEGAGLLLLTTVLPSGSSSNQCHITSWASDFEPGHMYSKEPYLGEGLSQTFASLFKKNKSTKKIKTVYSAMNGESYWIKEWGVTSLRHEEHFIDGCEFNHPAECYGDLGAASGPVMTTLAVSGMELKYNKSPALVYASSDCGERAAVIIDKQHV